KIDRPIAILADLQGPKLRIGAFAEPEVRIDAGNTFILDRDPSPGNSQLVELPHPEIFAAARVGDNLLLNDGRIRLVITEAGPDRLATQFFFGGALSARKGLNLPDTILAIPALTDKDRADLDYAANLGVDWI